jgi:hypothetical protein
MVNVEGSKLPNIFRAPMIRTRLPVRKPSRVVRTS